MNEEDLDIKLYLPIELLEYIFKLLSPKALVTCRVVCFEWQQAADRLTKDGKLWQKHCQRDYPDICDDAYQKSNPRLSWYHLYRSLTLWPKLPHSRQTFNQVASANQIQDIVEGFQVLSNGVVGIRGNKSIIYYDLNTLQKSQRDIIAGSYTKYVENDNFILLLDDNLELTVTKKATTNCSLEFTITLNNVCMFTLLLDVIYYVTMENILHFIQLINSKFISNFLGCMPNYVVSLGSKDGVLHLMTEELAVYKLVDDKMIFVKCVKDGASLFPELKRYNFLEESNWQTLFMDQFYITYYIPLSLNIVSLRSYGKYIFTGSRGGILNIYDSQYTEGVLELLDSTPLKTYNFMEQQDCRCELGYNIIDIDVVEGLDSHTVIVAMSHMVAVVNFSHNFERITMV